MSNTGTCVSQAVARPETVPARYLLSIHEDQRRAAVEWLSDHPGVLTLGFLLRLEQDLAETLSQLTPEDPVWDMLLRESCAFQIAEVQSAWQARLNRESPWRELLRFRGMHACAVRAPSDRLADFLTSDFLDGPATPIAGVIVGRPLVSPICRGSMIESQGIKPRPPDDEWEKVIRAVDQIPTNESYVDQLGIGQVSAIRDRHSGNERCACVLDSGADESHPALRQRIKAHALFDSHGGYKEAKYSIDRGCHGSKVTGIIAAARVAMSDLGIERAGFLDLGIAPSTQVAMVNIMEGGCRNERCTDYQLLAGFDWAVKHRRCGGYRIVNIGLEALEPLPTPLDEAVDDAIEFAQWNDLIPIFPSGNAGDASLRVGSRGLYVGATDRHGRLWKNTGNEFDLLTTGHEVLCCQPPVQQLSRHLLGCHSGTSYAAALLSGIAVLLTNATGRSERDVINQLIWTSADSRVNVDAAYRALLSGDAN